MRILVADDDPITRLTLKTLLSKRGYDVITASDGDEAHTLLLQDDAPPLAIIDWMMPGRDGVEVCRELRKAGKTSYTFIVMLSGRREKEDFIAGLAAGADDYVRKPYDIDELYARIRAAERILKLQEELRSKANEDDLTGALSRGAIVALLQRIAGHAEREGEPMSVILADIDNFKGVNDTHGHPVGDAVLREVSKRLGWALRAYDALGRYGGEEFLIALPGCAVANALQVAERMRSSIADEPVNTKAGMLGVTLSFGVSGSDDAQTLDTHALILSADNALYRAKRAGRNRVMGGADT